MYLTLLSEEPSDSDYHPYGYEEISDILEDILDIYGNSLSDNVRLYIQDYLQIIRRNIMKEDELKILAQKIYKSHKKAIDFIIENRGDISKGILDKFISKIHEQKWLIGTSSDSYKRFLTPVMDTIIPHNGTQWGGHEALLFEIIFHDPTDRVVFRCSISPGDPSTRMILDQILTNLDGGKKPRGVKRLSYFINKLENVSDEDFPEEYFDNFWNEIVEIVMNVEKAVLNEKDKFNEPK